MPAQSAIITAPSLIAWKSFSSTFLLTEFNISLFNLKAFFLKSTKSFETLGVYAMPTSYIFDENGKIVETIVGAVEWDSKEMIDKLKML